MSPSPTTKTGSATAQPDADTIEASQMKAWPYLLVYVVLSLIFVDFYRLTPVSPFFFLIFVFVMIPILDYFIGRDDYNPPAKVRKFLERRISFRNITLMWLPFYVGMVSWGVFYGYGQCKTVAEKVSLIINMGLVSAININMSHELIHKHSRLEHWFGRICLCITFYGHFTVEHLQGHHVNVSTEHDPASSKKGESLYAFLPRTIFGSIVSAWQLDAKTCNLLWAITGLMCLLVYPFGSVFFFAMQGIVGAIFLEIINYIEHYGLSRNPGEPVTPMHSWNAGDRLTNYILIKLQRHSDHHANPGWRFQTLRSWPHSPQLPYGYATMVVISLIPPLWFSIMDPKVDQVKKYFAKLERENTLNQVFTNEYLQEHPEDMKFEHWKSK